MMTAITIVEPNEEPWWLDVTMMHFNDMGVGFAALAMDMAESMMLVVPDESW